MGQKTMRARYIRRLFPLTALIVALLCAACGPSPVNDDPPITYPLAVKEADPLELVLLGEANGALSYQVDCIGTGNDISVTVGAGEVQSGQLVEKKTFAPAACPSSGIIIATGTLAFPMAQQGQSFVTLTIAPNPATPQSSATAGRVTTVTVPLAFEKDGHLHSGPTIVGA
jgi:hypothetical protein